jgi:hypothetical protein
MMPVTTSQYGRNLHDFSTTAGDREFSDIDRFYLEFQKQLALILFLLFGNRQPVMILYRVEYTAASHKLKAVL